MKIPNVVNVLGFAKNRQAAEREAAEVARIGRAPEIFWNIASRFDAFCIDRFEKSVPYMKKPSAFSCSRGHYHIMQKALDFGDEAVWVVEDDTRFLKDVGLVDEALASAPSDADILLLDSLPAGYRGGDNFERCMAKIRRMRGWWYEVDDEDLRSTGNYIMGKNAIGRYAEVLTRGVDGKVMRAADVFRNHNWFPACKIYAAFPNLSVQQIDPNGKHMASDSVLIERYESISVDKSNYQPW